MYTIKAPKIFQPFQIPDLIRLGKNNDGGYLVSEIDVLRSKKLLSIGIGEDWSFEEDFLKLNNCPLVAYDTIINADDAKYKNFFNGTKVHHFKNVGNQSNQVRLRDILVDDDTFLKCDIEGGEYDLFDEIIQLSSKITGIVIEVHNTIEMKNMLELFNLISKIKQKLIHIHVNNYFYYKTDNGVVPDIFELSFSSNENIHFNPAIDLPHRLDMTNNPNDNEFSIRF